MNDGIHRGMLLRLAKLARHAQQMQHGMREQGGAGVAPRYQRRDQMLHVREAAHHQRARHAQQQKLAVIEAAQAEGITLIDKADVAWRHLALPLPLAGDGTAFGLQHHGEKLVRFRAAAWRIADFCGGR